jgi:hypothetical protein
VRKDSRCSTSEQEVGGGLHMHLARVLLGKNMLTMRKRMRLLSIAKTYKDRAYFIVKKLTFVKSFNTNSIPVGNKSSPCKMSIG